MSNFSSIQFHGKRLYVHMFYIVDTPFSLWKRIDRLLITSGIFQDKTKHSACDLKADTAFLLHGTELYCVPYRFL